MSRRVDAFSLTGQPWMSRIAPSRFASDLVRKRWMEAAVPTSLAILLCILILAFTPVSATDMPSVLSETAEKGLMAVGLTIVLVGGGIDLSIGSMFGVVALSTLILDRAFGVPMIIVVFLAPLIGALLGSVNGVLIAYFKTRPFITTLVTLIVFRGLVVALQEKFALDLTMPSQSLMWTFLGRGKVLGLPTLWFIFIVVLIVAHFALTRTRWGWHVVSVGSDRRSARRNGINLDRTVFSTYVISGALAGMAGLLTSARLGRADSAVGAGTELVVLTAVVLGGVSLKGGRGSVVRATIGMFVVAMIQQATIVLQLENGSFQAILAIVLIAFAVLDLKWGDHRERLAEKLSLDPGRVAVGELVDVSAPGTVWTVNDALTDAPPIGLGQIEGAEDCAIATNGDIYCGDRRGWIWRFPEGRDHDGEIFARTGGLPLGHAWHTDGTLLVAVGGIGVQRIHRDGEVEIVANQVRRSRVSLHDDSAIRFADDLDVAPDGSIYVSDFSTRTNPAEYALEFVECRPNGRVVRIDPDGSTDVVVSNHVFPNGICTAHDGQSVLIASTGLFRVDRLWISGPKQGRMEPVLENLPGYPDNLNRASDGGYWMSFVAMRTPVSDLLLRYPAFRRRMVKELPVDDWLVPQLNVSCVLKFTEKGEVTKVLWDGSLENYPMVTSINEFDGFLYLCGVHNNRLGRLRLDPEDIGPIDTRIVPGAATATTFADVRS